MKTALKSINTWRS